MRFNNKFQRTSGRTEGEKRGNNSVQTFPQQSQLLASDIMNGGMVTSIHSYKLQNNQCALVQGHNIKFDGLERRGGHSILTPAKPNSNTILLFSNFKRFDGTIKIFRFTKNSVHLWTSGAWIAVTGAALTGGDTDRFQSLSFLDRLFFNNNGADVLQEIDLTANTYASAGNATKYKYYTTCNRRIVGANLVSASPNPIEIGWSGDLAPTQWDFTVDPSAGRQTLLESSGGAGDDITGIFNFDNTLLVTRERSIWLGDVTSVASLPFNFRQGLPGIGASIPYAISQVRGGVAWYDKRLQNVFAYFIGSGGLNNSNNVVESSAGLSPIGDPIKYELTDVDPNNIFSSFDPKNNTYELFIFNPNSTKVPVWRFNFDVNEWTYDEMTSVSGAWYLDFSKTSTTIGDLVGTIGDLVGTIGGLSSNQTQVTQFIGKSNGDILQQDDTLTQEGGSNFTSVIQSKEYKLPSFDVYIAELKLIYIPIIAGTFTVAYSVDGGVTFIDYETVAYNSSNSKKQVLTSFKKYISCRQFTWRITSTTGRFKLVEYEIHVFSGADSRGP